MQQQFIEAGTLMLAGMVFVFAFLGILIVFINTVLARLAIRFPDPIVTKPTRITKTNKGANASNNDLSPAVVAAIGGAIKRYRTEHAQQ